LLETAPVKAKGGAPFGAFQLQQSSVKDLKVQNMCLNSNKIRSRA